jgi:acetyl-CoA carboxylase biotin carboxylase subunit
LKNIKTGTSLLENPRYIEIQILADSCGNTVHLWERECSVQRRGQKIIEEAPSLFLDDELSTKIGHAAVQAARSIGYRNAGTVEFLVDEDKNFCFLEMKPWLQVEHAVTEEITGLDLVAEQIKIAAGYALNFSQSDIKRTGHAIEVRIYAAETFLTSSGTIKVDLPEVPGIRHELTVNTQSILSPYIDPIIAKFVVKGRDRDEAIARLQKALEDYKVHGIKTNIPFLKEAASQPAFRSGNITKDLHTKYMHPNQRTVI